MEDARTFVACVQYMGQLASQLQVHAKKVPDESHEWKKKVEQVEHALQQANRRIQELETKESLPMEPIISPEVTAKLEEQVIMYKEQVVEAKRAYGDVQRASKAKENISSSMLQYAGSLAQDCATTHVQYTKAMENVEETTRKAQEAEQKAAENYKQLQRELEVGKEELESLQSLSMNLEHAFEKKLEDSMMKRQTALAESMGLRATVEELEEEVDALRKQRKQVDDVADDAQKGISELHMHLSEREKAFQVAEKRIIALELEVKAATQQAALKDEKMAQQRVLLKSAEQQIHSLKQKVEKTAQLTGKKHTMEKSTTGDEIASLHQELKENKEKLSEVLSAQASFDDALRLEQRTRASLRKSKQLNMFLSMFVVVLVIASVMGVPRAGLWDDILRLLHA